MAAGRRAATSALRPREGARVGGPLAHGAAPRGPAGAREPGRPIVLVFGAGLHGRRFSRPAAADRPRRLRLRPLQVVRESPGRGAGRAIVVPPPGVSARSLAGAAREAEAIAEAVRWARDVGNTPGNDLGPAELAGEAQALCERRRLSFRVLGKKEIERERMGGLLGVNAGSARPPVFLVGEYAPARPRGTAVLVGKGITFDTGGISLKPAPSMGEMKYDMMGAATVLACLAPRRPGASRAGRRARARDREHAGRLGAAPRRHPPDAQRQDGRGRQHGRRGPAHPGRRALLRREILARRAPRLRHADRRGADRPRPRVRRGHDRRRRTSRALSRPPARPRASASGACPLWHDYRENSAPSGPT